MSDTQAEQHVNGTAPAAAPAADAPCEDCATPMEKIMAGITLVFAIGLAILAIDMFTGGRITGSVTAAVQEATQ